MREVINGACDDRSRVCDHGETPIAWELQVLAATQTPKDSEWFQGTADAVRQYNWMFDDVKNRIVQDIVILSGDHLCATHSLVLSFLGVLIA